MTLTPFESTANQGVDDGTHGEVKSDLQWYRSALLIAFAITTYLSVPLLSGGSLLVPSFPTVALAPFLLLAVWSSISNSDMIVLPKLCFVLLVTIALSPGYEYMTQKFLALVQCVIAIGTAILVVRLMHQLRYELVERSLLILWCLLIGGSVLELTGVTRDVSDSFREWAYGGTFTIYEGEERDINMVGWPRPKLFSVEPSHVTKFFIAAVNSWLLVRVTWRKVWIVAGATLAMLIIMGSPMLLVSAAITFAIVLWDRRAATHTKIAMILGALLVGTLFGMYYGESIYTGIADRLSDVNTDIQERTDLGSEEQRIVYPYMILADTWSRWPFFGVGIGGKEIVFENAIFPVRDADAAVGNNVMAEMWMYLGLIGGVLFLHVLQRHAKRTGVHRIGLLALIVAMFSQLLGGMVTFRYWGFIVLFWGAMAVADAHAKVGAVVSRK